MPHRPPHRPPHAPRHSAHPTWYENEEKERPLKDIGTRIEQIGALLKEHGAVQIGDSTIAPADPCSLIVRYERTPHGSLLLKLEVDWPESTQSTSKAAHDEDLEISAPR